MHIHESPLGADDALAVSVVGWLIEQFVSLYWTCSLAVCSVLGRPVHICTSHTQSGNPCILYEISMTAPHPLQWCARASRSNRMSKDCIDTRYNASCVFTDAEHNEIRHLCHCHHCIVVKLGGTALCARYHYRDIPPTRQAWSYLEDLQHAYRSLRVWLTHVTVHGHAIVYIGNSTLFKYNYTRRQA